MLMIILIDSLKGNIRNSLTDQPVLSIVIYIIFIKVFFIPVAVMYIASINGGFLPNFLFEVMQKFNVFLM